MDNLIEKNRALGEVAMSTAILLLLLYTWYGGENGLVVAEIVALFVIGAFAKLNSTQ